MPKGKARFGASGLNPKRPHDGPSITPHICRISPSARTQVAAADLFRLIYFYDSSILDDIGLSAHLYGDDCALFGISEGLSGANFRRQKRTKDRIITRLSMSFPLNFLSLECQTCLRIYQLR
jgi:hypothetical protein